MKVNARNLFYWLLQLLVVCSVVLLSSSSASASIRVFLNGGYTSIKPDASGTDFDGVKFTGFSLGGLTQTDLVFHDTNGIFLGLGLQYSAPSNEKIDYKVISLGEKVTATFKSLYLTGEIGAYINPLPKVGIQGAIGFDYGTFGTLTIDSVTTDETKRYTLNYRFRLSVRPLYFVLPKVFLGGEFSYFPGGDIKLNRSDKTGNNSGLYVAVVAGITI